MNPSPDRNPKLPDDTIRPKKFMTPNAEWKKVATSLIAAVIFVIIIFISYLFIEGMDRGYAIAFISLFLAISSIAVALLFVHRARVMDTILADPSPLAHWTYPEDVAQVSVEREYGEFQERNRAVFFIVGGMLMIVALFFLIFVEDGGLETGLFLLALTVFLFLVSRVMPRIERQRAMKASRDAYISHFGIIYEGVVYPFRSFMMWQTGIHLRNASNKKPMVIIFSFSQLVGRFIIQPFDVAIPVPAGEEETAVRIVQVMGGKVPDGYP